MILEKDILKFSVTYKRKFYLNKPTIGVAKKYHKIENVDYTMPPNEEHAYTDIVIKGQVYGRVLRTHKNVKPIFAL